MADKVCWCHSRFSAVEDVGSTKGCRWVLELETWSRSTAIVRSDDELDQEEQQAQNFKIMCQKCCSLKSIHIHNIYIYIYTNIYSYKHIYIHVLTLSNGYVLHIYKTPLWFIYTAPRKKSPLTCHLFFTDQPKFDGKNGPFARQSWNRPMPPTRQGHPDSVGFVWICRLFRTEARQAKIDLPAEKPDTILLTIKLVEKWWWW